MKINNFNHALLGGTIVCLTLAISPGSFAVDDTALSDISLQFTDAIDIAAVQNVQIVDPATGTDAKAIEDFCVAGMGFSTFEILFESDNGVGVFELVGGGNKVPYLVGYDNSTAGIFTPIIEGTALTGQALNDIATSCIGIVDNSRFEITILNASWENGTILSGGPYTDALTITVTSE
ncbi:hypothetical protein ACCI51_06350 [Microbulbifer echini]|uniref:Secreted protein n=1 Tax=Microbulbifer echini TaxID=1529067 RepID=A0ABV4NLG8_9GAMM